MDMLVTTPKSEIDNSRREGEAVEAEGGYWFRTYRFKPKVEPENRIYFVENGKIRGYGIIFQIFQAGHAQECDITGRDWGNPGDWVVCYKDWHWLKGPVPFKGFQGIRYIDRLPELRQKLNQNAPCPSNKHGA